MLVLVYALTGFLGGGSFWQQSALATFGVPQQLGPLAVPKPVYNLSFMQWYMVQGALVLVLNTVWSAQNVIKARRARGDRSRGALLGLWPFFAVWLLIVTYLYLQPNIRQSHLVPFGLFAGMVNAYSVGRIITAHLVGLKFPYFNVLGLPLAFGVLDSLGPALLHHLPTGIVGWPSSLGDGVYQVAYMFCMVGIAVGVYGSFVVDVIITICDYLDIWCLRIKHPLVQQRSKENGLMNGKARKVH